jgi:hypothetical protein
MTASPASVKHADDAYASLRAWGRNLIKIGAQLNTLTSKSDNRSAVELNTRVANIP